MSGNLARLQKYKSILTNRKWLFYSLLNITLMILNKNQLQYRLLSSKCCFQRYINRYDTVFYQRTLIPLSMGHLSALVIMSAPLDVSL